LQGIASPLAFAGLVLAASFLMSVYRRDDPPGARPFLTFSVADGCFAGRCDHPERGVVVGVVDQDAVSWAQAVIGSEASVRKAIPAFPGPRPGLEALAIVPVLLVVQLLPIDGLALSALAGAAACVLAFCVVAGLRTFVTIARTHRVGADDHDRARMMESDHVLRHRTADVRLDIGSGIMRR
jgi:hypothetical protein